MVSVRGLYCMFIRTTSAPAFCNAVTPWSTAPRKLSISTDRIASTVPVCHTTRVGFFAPASLPRSGAISSAVFAGPVPRIRSRRARQFLAKRHLQPRRIGVPSAPEMVEERLPTTRMSSGPPVLTAEATRAAGCRWSADRPERRSFGRVIGAREGAGRQTGQQEQRPTSSRRSCSSSRKIRVAVGGFGAASALAGNPFVPRKYPSRRRT